jgi:hypothetical protein
MRNLSSKQKKSLKAAVIRYNAINKKFPVCVDEMDEFTDIESMNLFEDFWSHAQRYVDDLKHLAEFDYMFDARW